MDNVKTDSFLMLHCSGKVQTAFVANKPNLDLRTKMLWCGVGIKELATFLGMHESNLCHYLNRNLSEEWRNRIDNGIDAIANSKQ